MTDSGKSLVKVLPSLHHQSINQLTFPYHLMFRPDNNQPYDVSIRNHCKSSSNSERKLPGHSFFQSPSLNVFRSVIFPKVYAAEKEKDDAAIKEPNDDNNDTQQREYAQAMEALAKAYIQSESGWDRVKMLFQKDHRGKSNIEMNYIHVVLVQVFVLTFFFKYVPVARFARKEFIREHQGTVFRTRFEAIRRLQDHTFLKAGGEAASFSTKMTLFSASFLFLSSMVSSYRNKTSVLEYAVAAGLTGGLARINMGLKGFIAGSVVGGVLGSAVGLLGYFSLKAYHITQEERHLEAIKNKLEVIRSIEGDSGFQTKVNAVLTENKTTLPTPTS